MPAKPAPLKTRPTVYEGTKVPVKIKRLLDQPVVCAQVGEAYDALRLVGLAVLLDLPDYCKKKEVESGPVVTAFSIMLSTFEVFKEQYELDKKNAQPEKKA